MKTPLENRRGMRALLCLGIALFLFGCARPPICFENAPSCQLTVPTAGTYSVTYKDLDDNEQTVELDSFGSVLVVCNCRSIVGEPELSSPATADLSISMVDLPDPVSVGGEITYEITVHNNGLFDALNGAMLIDTLPLELNFVSASSTSGSCNYSSSSREVACELNPIQTNTDVHISLITEIAFAPVDAEVKNGATINLKLNDVVVDSHPENDSAKVTTSVGTGAGADLGVTITDSPDPIDAENLTYTITITNQGPDTSSGATLTDFLPTGVDLFSTTGRCSELHHVVTCSLDPLQSGASTTIQIIVTPTVAAVTITDTVLIAGNEFDPNHGNNEAIATTTVIRPALTADLALAISDSPDPVVVGQPLTYNLTVTNKGLATATGVTLTDVLPEEVTFIPNPNCSLAGNTVTCIPVSLPNGASTTYAIAVVPSKAGAISNSASVMGLQIDPYTTNNTATETTTVNEPAPSADVSITMSDSPDPVVVNQQLSYDITVTNNGLATATDIRLTDTLPSGVTFIANPDCRVDANNIVTCIPFSLPNGASTTVRILVTPTVTGTISNIASVTALESDPNTADNTSTETTTISEPAPTADLSVIMSDSPDPVVVNQQLTYNITVTNNGLATATDITLTDTLPSGVNFLANQNCRLTSNNTVTCMPFSLPNGASTTVSIVVTPTAAGTITNTAGVSALQSDPNTADNSTTEVTTVSGPTPPADLSVTLSDAPDPVVVNQELSYNIIVTNHGPSAATNISVTDTLPSGVSFVANPNCQLLGNTVTCSLGTLLNQASATFTIAVVPTAIGTIANTVSVTALEPDPNAPNNTATEATTVDPPPASDLSVSISGSPDPVFADEQLTYNITVTNNGPDMATGITVTDVLPSNVTFRAGTDCQLMGNTVTCTSSSLASGATRTFTFSVTPTVDGTVTNTVSVSGLVNDPNATNNSATAITAVQPSAGLVVTIIDNPDPVAFNGALTYTVTVTNNGPSTATNVVLFNLLPPIEVNNSDIVLSQGSFTRTNRPYAITCSFGTLASGASATLTVTGFTFAHGPIEWNATVTANEHDPNPANNAAAETTTVN